MAAAIVTPIPILTLEGPVGIDRTSGALVGWVGGRNIIEAVASVLNPPPTRETSGGEERACGLYRLTLSVIQS